MRKLFLTIVSVLLVLIFNGIDTGNASSLCPNPGELEETIDIPNQDIVFYAKTIIGIIPIPIPKGALNTNKEGVYWDVIKNYMRKEEAKEKFQKEEHKFNEKYFKEHPEAFGKKQPI